MKLVLQAVAWKFNYYELKRITSLTSRLMDLLKLSPYKGPQFEDNVSHAELVISSSIFLLCFCQYLPFVSFAILLLVVVMHSLFDKYRSPSIQLVLS